MVEVGEQRPEPTDEYPKADVVHRFIAKFIDFLIVAALARLIPSVGPFAGLTYLLIADGLFEGRSAGKWLIGLKALRSDQESVATFRESILRNIPFAAGYLCLIIPFVGWLIAGGIVLVEGLLVIGNPQGNRIGDEIAKTRVIDQKSSVQAVPPERTMKA